MKYIELQEAFEREINMLDNDLEKPMSTDTEYWLNQGLEKFYKTRYTGLNFKRTGFEQDQKRIDDLRTLISTKAFILDEEAYQLLQEDTSKIKLGHKAVLLQEQIPSDSIHPVSHSMFQVRLPNDYIFLLSDTVGIIPTCKQCVLCAEKDENGELVVQYNDTLEATLETIDRQLHNSLSEHKYKYNSARPLRLVQNNSILLYTDGKYKVQEYLLQYLRFPSKIDIHKNPFDNYTDMPEHTHLEIVKLAAQLYLENKTSGRYNTYNNEINSME